MKKLLARSETIPAILLAVAFGWAASANPYFLDPTYLLSTTSLYAETALLVLGMTFVIVTGNIDLSVAGNLALVACVVAKLCAAGMPLPLAALAGVVLGGLLGAVNGVLVAYAKLPSFLVTLGTMALFRGVAQAMMGASSVQLPPSFVGIDQFALGPTGVPLPLLIVVVLAILAGLALHRTIYGRWVFTVGANEDAAFFSGVPTAKVKFAVFVFVGLMAGVGALLMDSRLGVARYDHAKGMELDVITATVLGGVSIQGGRGTLFGAMLALLLVAVAKTAMGLANVTAEYQLTAIGTLLIVSVGVGAAISRLSSRRK